MRVCGLRRSGQKARTRGERVVREDGNGARVYRHGRLFDAALPLPKSVHAINSKRLAILGGGRPPLAKNLRAFLRNELLYRSSFNNNNYKIVKIVPSSIIIIEYTQIVI